MIYLFDRLYLESDHYIRNDKKKVTALLGPSAAQAKLCSTLSFDFGETILNESVKDQDLAQYLENLVHVAQGKRVVVYTNHETMIKILALHCSSIFENPTHEFVKHLIELDILWINLSPGVSGHRDWALRHKSLDNVDCPDIDYIIEQGMCIEPKITKFNQLRIEFLFAAYLNGTLPVQQVQELETKLTTLFCKNLWPGDHIKTYAPTFLTLAKQQAGLDLDNFSINDLRNLMPNYFKIFDTAMRGTVESWEKVTARDHQNFYDQQDKDFKSKIRADTREIVDNFYVNKKKFIRDKVLSGGSADEYWVAVSDLGTMIKANPYLWYKIAGSYQNTSYLDQFSLNV